MKIFDISVKNFRGISSLRRLKAGEINSYVGKNDSGKSTILKALDAFFNEKFTANDIFKGIPEGEKTEITIRFDCSETLNPLALDEDGKVQLKKTFYFSLAGKLVKELTYTCYDVNSEEAYNCWGVKEADINGFLTRLGIDYSRSGRGVTNLSKIELIDLNTQQFGRLIKEYPADEYIKNLKRSYEWFDIPDYSLFDAEQDLSITSTSFQTQFKPIATQALQDNATLTAQIEENVQSELEREFGFITELMQKNAPELERIKPYINCNWAGLVKFDLSLKFSTDDFDIPLANKGTGFKRLLMVAYFQYLAQKATKKYQIFGIEEPETFLHPELQQDLLDSIITLSEVSQFFITTHSPVFAGATKNSNIVVVKKQHSISQYLNFENVEDILDVVIRELGIKPNYNLLNDNFKKVVFVEGSGDVKFWQSAIRGINEAMPDDILIIPCGGDQVDFFVNAELCRKINRRFMFVLDSDRGAVDYESKLANKAVIIAKVAELGGETYLLRKREIENYYSRSAIQRLLGSSYTLPTQFSISDYDDIKEQIKTHIIVPSQLNFKAKNNFDIFNSMTRDEWIEAGYAMDNTTDLQIIIGQILSN